MSRPNWKAKVRNDYKGIVSKKIVDGTIKYWESIIAWAEYDVLRKMAKALADRRRKWAGKNINKFEEILYLEHQLAKMEHPIVKRIEGEFYIKAGKCCCDLHKIKGDVWFCARHGTMQQL